MQITVDKCETCGAIFTDPAKYAAHMEAHAALLVLEGAFPTPLDDGCKFANGNFAIQRDRDWLMQYKGAVKAIVPQCDFEPWSYGWFRILDDGGSPYYGVALRALRVCPQCYREWGQPYFTNNCLHVDKPKPRKEEGFRGGFRGGIYWIIL